MAPGEVQGAPRGAVGAGGRRPGADQHVFVPRRADRCQPQGQGPWEALRAPRRWSRMGASRAARNCPERREDPDLCPVDVRGVREPGVDRCARHRCGRDDLANQHGRRGWLVDLRRRPQGGDSCRHGLDGQLYRAGRHRQGQQARLCGRDARRAPGTGRQVAAADGRPRLGPRKRPRREGLAHSTHAILDELPRAFQRLAEY
mmetsp:Transcript_6344/g.18136  ORF Transcript_6344/g.18136 Transcript_6344/m.18136 type:complete len:202 (-) Transcript_6344:126-731(-)